MRSNFPIAIASLLTFGGFGCGAPPFEFPTARNWATAPVALVDRFSEAAGDNWTRARNPLLPGPGAPIDFDQCCTIRGLGPRGQRTVYYDLDVQPQRTAPIYQFGNYQNGTWQPAAGIRPVLGSIPGERGYSDLHHVVRVVAPAEVVDGTLVSETELRAAMRAGAIQLESTTDVLNAPVVPEGSTAQLRMRTGQPTGTTDAWYAGQRVYFLTFEQPGDVVGDGSRVALSPGFVFMDQQGQIPRDNDGATRTVFATLPGIPGYSPLWDIFLVPAEHFASVSPNSPNALSTISRLSGIRTSGMTVNCPVVRFDGVIDPGEY